jgi:hypothetical protein
MHTEESHRQQVEPPQERTMWAANYKATGEGLPKLVGAHTTARHAAIGLPGFRYCFGPIPPFLRPICPLKWECLLFAILYWEYVTFFLISQWLTAKRLP